jgi:hypothetical protein
MKLDINNIYDLNNPLPQCLKCGKVSQKFVFCIKHIQKYKEIIFDIIDNMLLYNEIFDIFDTYKKKAKIFGEKIEEINNTIYHDRVIKDYQYEIYDFFSRCVNILKYQKNTSNISEKIKAHFAKYVNNINMSKEYLLFEKASLLYYNKDNIIKNLGYEIVLENKVTNFIEYFRIPLYLEINGRKIGVLFQDNQENKELNHDCFTNNIKCVSVRDFLLYLKKILPK